MIKFSEIFFLSILILLFSSCAGRNNYLDSDTVLATVGKDELLLSEVPANVYSGEAFSEQDSLVFLEAYVESWTRKQLKYQQAEKLLSDQEDINRMIQEYRHTLLSHRLDQYIIDNRLDTLLSTPQIEEYYRLHKSDFPLDRTIVKGIIVKVPDSYRQKNKIKELLGDSSQEGRQDFFDTVLKNDFQMDEFSSWTDFNEFLSYLPTRRDSNYNDLLKTGVQELSDSQNKYYFIISDFLTEGQTAPLERVSDVISRIIYNQRRTEILREYEDSLYRVALDNRIIEINVK